MATILEFKYVSRPTVASVLAAHGVSQSAEIVLFPGVRYERHVETEESKQKRGKPRHDKLELDG